ncbi:hypothetical protein [Pseudonocardia ailaonensis]
MSLSAEHESESILVVAAHLDQMQELPRGLRRAVAHVLRAAAREIQAGRPLPIDVVRAVREVLLEVEQLTTGRAGELEDA